MELDAFTSRLGEGQGLVPSTEGALHFVLGDVERGRRFNLAPGDHVEVTQTTDLTGIALVRAIVTLRVPKIVPDNLAWEVSVVVDGAKRARATCAPGRTRRIAELAANVSKLAGDHAVGVRLELVAT